MDYKKLAAAGMSAALLLSIGGSALAKAPSKAPRENTPISQSRPSDSGKTSGGAPKKGTASLRSESDRVPESGRAGKTPDASGEQMNGKPSRKPTRKPDQKSDAATDSSRNTNQTEKKSETKTESGKHRSSKQTTETLSDQGTKPETSSGGKQRKQSAQIEYDAANSVSASAAGASYTSTNDSENAVLVSGDKVTLTNATVDKTGDASGDNADFYGVNATVLAKDGAELTIEGATITSNGAHANGVFSYGEGTKVEISGSTITTTGNTSGGLMTTGGGTMIANNLTVKTSGNSSAAIRSDRGGGTVIVNGGSYESNGVGSPAIYSTADITVNEATLTSTASEGVIVEGKNSVTLNGVTLTDTNTKHAGKSSTDKNIFLYQSMSGDASVGTAKFEANDSTIVTNRGDTIYVTNTTAEIELKNNRLVNNANGALLRVKAAKWGTAGKNGGDVTLELENQKASGDIVIDALSTLAMKLEDGSAYTGAVNGANTAKSVVLTLEAGTKWVLTGDSYLSALDGDTSGIDLNGHTLYVGGVAWAR